MSYTSLALCCGVDGEAGWWLAVPVSSSPTTFTDHNDEYGLWKTLTDSGGIRCAWLFADRYQHVEGYQTYRPRSSEPTCFIIRESVFRLVRVYRTTPNTDTFRVRLAGFPAINAAFKQYESELSDADEDESSDGGGEEEVREEKVVVPIHTPTPVPTPTQEVYPKLPEVKLDSLLLVSVRDLQALLATTRRYHLTDMLSPTHCRACSSVIHMPQSVPVTGLRMKLPPIPRQGISPDMLASQRQFLSTATTGGNPSRFIELKCRCAHPPTYYWCRAGVRMIHHINVADWNEAVASNLPAPKGCHGGKRART